MQYIGSNIRFIFTKIKELLNSHNTDNSAHSELFKSWKRLRNPNNADIADALAATYKNGIGDVLVEVKDDTTFALEDIKLFFRPASFKLISANESDYEGIYITMDGTHGRYVAKTFADSEIMMPEGPTTISTPSELVLYPAASDAVLYTPQTLTEAQQKQARANIGALDVNIKTTPVDTDVTLFGRGENIVYVKDGWLKPCPTDADNELILQYRRVFEFIGSQYLEPSSEDILLEAKSAYALYQKGLASERIKVTNNPLRAAQVYVTWDITTRSNKHYVYYTQVSTAYNYDCTYCVEDNALTSERYQRAIYSHSTGVGKQDNVSQFRMSAAPTEDMHVATKQYVDTAKTEAQQLGLTTTTPGKTIKVKTVQDGKPTEWEVADIYERPDTGIPKTDLADNVQTSLAKADTAISYNSQTLTEEQQEQARTNIGAGQPVFVVNVTATSDDNYTADKTAAEIEVAYQAGRTIVCRMSWWVGPIELPLKSRTQERVFIFVFDHLLDRVISSLVVQISDSGTILGPQYARIYEKPTSGIPKSDLADDVQTSLAKADTSISYDSQTLTDAQKQQARTNIGVGQSDWNQNDSTQPDYVKNRPFYTGNPVESVLVEESTVTFAENEGMYTAQFPSTFAATVGETYKVYWDGAAYECTCVSFNGEHAIGNLSIVGAGSDTGEPFIIGIRNGKEIQIVTADTSASHTFSISGFTQEVVKIDAKYLPDTVATKSEVKAAQTKANAAQTKANAAQTTANNAQTTANNAQTTADNAQTTANAALERTVEPYTRSIQMAPLYKNGGFSAWRGVVQEIGYNKTKGYFFADAFDTTALKEEDMPKDVFCVNVHVGSQSATAFLTKVVSGDGNDLWSVIGFAVITDGYYRTGEVLYVSSNAISRNETKGLFLTFKAPDSMLLKSSTANSTKQFRVTVDDSGVPTITDESDSTNTWKPTNLPTVTSSDSGKFLRVSDTGEWVAETILSATVSNNTLIIRQCGGINNGGIYRY